MIYPLDIILQPEGGVAKEKETSSKNEANFRNDDELLPVMVFVHGGGFTSGESNLYGPSYLLDRNVILVTLNYRLGPLGFLNLGSDVKYKNDVPTGNQGLWDQREGNVLTVWDVCTITKFLLIMIKQFSRMM